MAQISLAWSMSKECTSPSTPSSLSVAEPPPVVTAPIVGTTSLKNLEELIGASPTSHLPPPFTSHSRVMERERGR